MKYSIIIPTVDNFEYFSQCLLSVIRNTSDYELIAVFNGPNDQSLDYFKTFIPDHPNFRFILFDDQLGFSKAVNRGMESSKGDYIILLNDDTIVTPSWATLLSEAVWNQPKNLNFWKIGLVGPVSNNAAYIQGVDIPPYNVSDLDSILDDHIRQYRYNYKYPGFLSGFCLLITRECFNDCGFFDESFAYGGFEDNDYCLRAHLNGYRSVCVPACFIHHYGQRTLKRINVNHDTLFYSNQHYLFSKHYSPTAQKLFVVCRIHNGENYLPDWIKSVKSYADKVIFLLDRCTDRSNSIIAESDLDCFIIHSNDSFNEIRDRKLLFDTAIAQGADWIISLDVDEIFDENFSRDVAVKLMHPANVETFGYTFQFRNFWLSNSYYRSDGVFGHMRGQRMFRVTDHGNLASFEHDGLHCTHVPLIPSFYCREVPYNILHFGYNTDYKCTSKYEFYTTLDPDPDKTRVGPDGYSHLVSPNVTLTRYSFRNTLGLLVLVKDDLGGLFSLLYEYYHYFHEIIVVNSGNPKGISNLCKIFGAQVFHFTGSFDFSSARNYGKKFMTSSWILSLDCDEKIDHNQFPRLYYLLDQEYDGYLFRVANYMPSGKTGYSDNVRLFRNKPEYFWTGLVHEHISKSISANGGKISIAPCIIRHYGYLKPRSGFAKKTAFYYSLLRKHIRKYKSDPLGYFHLAFYYREKNDWATFSDLLKKSISLDKSFFLAYKELGLYHLSEAIHYFSDFLDHSPDSHFFRPWASEVLRLLHDAQNVNAGKIE